MKKGPILYMLCWLGWIVPFAGWGQSTPVDQVELAHQKYIAGDLTGALGDLNQAIATNPGYFIAFDVSAMAIDYCWIYFVISSENHFTESLAMVPSSLSSFRALFTS